MSVAISSSFVFAGKQIAIYLATFILVVSGLLLTVVFLSLRTFRQSLDVFYFTIMSLVNISQMITGLLFHIMQTSFGIDWSTVSLLYCKLRYYLLISSVCIYINDLRLFGNC